MKQFKKLFMNYITWH